MLAHPRLDKDEKCLAHDLEKTTVHFDVPLAFNNGNLSGSANISGEHLSRILGQANADTNHLKSITVKSATSNVACAMGGNISYGSLADETHSPIQTVDRVTNVCGDTNALKAYHMVVPPGCVSGHVTAFGMDTTTTFANVETPQTRMNASDAVSRQLRWEPGMEANISGSCTKVSANNQTRYLVPHGAGETNCGMSKLLKQNETSQGFCGDAYNPRNRTAVENEKGQMCTVMTEAHFTGLRDQLAQKLTTKHASKAGLTLSFNSTNNNANIDNLTAMGGTPRVTCTAEFARVPTKTFLANTDSSPSSVMHVDHYHELLGETAGGSVHKLASVVSDATSSEGFAKKIMALKLSGVRNEEENAAASGPIVVEAATENGSD